MREAFDDLVASLDYPMVIVTGSVDGERAGCLAGFTSQCSIEPPRWIVCISKANHTHDVAMSAPMLVVHTLRASQHGLATLFGSASGDEIDKFEHCDWSPGPGESPVLAETDWFAGCAVARWDVGDHTAILVDVLTGGSSQRSDEPQLGYQQVREVEPGHGAGG